MAVQSEDGKIVDEWVEYIGSLNYPIQNWGRKDIKRSRTAYFNYDHDAFKLLAFPFFEDPIYGQYVEVERPLDVQFDGGDYFKDCTISMGDKTLNLTLNCFYTTMRYFCYTYRNGNELDIHTFEVGPYRDGDNAPASSCLTFPGIPSNDPYAIVLNEERLSTSINVPQKSNVTGQSFDLQGRQLKSAPQKGVYIQNGKKVLVK